MVSKSSQRRGTTAAGFQIGSRSVGGYAKCEMVGAMVCEYDFFKILYRSEARSIARNGHSANICLLSVSGKDGEMLARRSLDTAMNNLQVLVQNNLRRGDVIARCSISQYIILLPQANYENSRMVADRLVSAFYRRYPHSPARLRYTVQPLA